MRRMQRMTLQESDPRLTDLMKAIINQDVDLVTAILESGADLEARDYKGQNVLYHAFPAHLFSEKAMKILKQLVLKGINVNSSLDSDGCSALVTAIVKYLPEVTALLIENGVDVNEPAMSKFSSCLTTDTYSEDATSQFFFSKGCGHSVTPLMSAVIYSHHDLAEMLIKADAGRDWRSSGSFWRTSVHSVCSNCDVQVTPLHMAAYMGDLKMAHMLLNHQANSNRISEPDKSSICNLSYNDISPLWFALLEGHESVVKLFLSLAKPNAPPCHFGSGLQVCLQEGHVAIAHMLLRAGYCLEDDLDWIQSRQFPTSDKGVIEKIISLVEEPRPLWECCAFALRDRFGLSLQEYLRSVGAPQKICDILDFNDLSDSSWRLPSVDMKQQSVKEMNNSQFQATETEHDNMIISHDNIVVVI